MSIGMAGSGADFFSAHRPPSHPVPGAYTAALYLVSAIRLVEGQAVQVGLLNRTGSLGWSEMVAAGYRRVSARIEGSGDRATVSGPVVFGPDVLAWPRPVGVALFDEGGALLAAGEGLLATARPGTGVMTFDIGALQLTHESRSQGDD